MWSVSHIISPLSLSLISPLSLSLTLPSPPPPPPPPPPLCNLISHFDRLCRGTQDPRLVMKFLSAPLLFLMRLNPVRSIYESIREDNSQLMVASRPNISLFRCIRFDGAGNLIHKFVYCIILTQLLLIVAPPAADDTAHAQQRQ